jgi:Fe-S-cluster-containing hydrogenase component 2
VDVAYLPQPCLHCEDAPCIRRIRDGAIRRRDDGIVLIDPERARGRREIQQACPFGAIWWNDEQKVAQKCTFCAHLLDTGWRVPRCVQACPTGALSVQRLQEDDLPRWMEQQGVALPYPEHGVRAGGVCYRNLPRFFAGFVAGSLASKRSGVAECLAGALVTLLRDGVALARVRSDVFGDFKFDGLPDGSGGYRLRIETEGLPAREIEVQGQASCALGTLWL